MAGARVLVPFLEKPANMLDMRFTAKGREPFILIDIY